MAIKGKKKPKARSPRVVTAGPRRPVYVQPKVPLFQRTGAKFLVALIAEAIVFSLLVGFAEQSKSDRQREAIEEFTTLTQAALARGGQAIVPLPGGAQVLANLPTRLSELRGEVEPPPKADVIAEAELWSSSLVDAADAVGAVQIPSESLDDDQRLALAEARNLMSRGLRMFAGLADQLLVAVEIKGRPQQDLIAAMEAQIPVATETFSAGFGRLTSVREQAGLSTTGTVPGGGFPPPPQVVPGFDPTMPVQEVPADGGGGGNGGDGGNG